MKTQTLQRLYPDAPIALVAEIMSTLTIVLGLWGDIKSMMGDPFVLLTHCEELRGKIEAFSPKSAKRRREAHIALCVAESAFRFASEGQLGIKHPHPRSPSMETRKTAHSAGC